MSKEKTTHDRAIKPAEVATHDRLLAKMQAERKQHGQASEESRKAMREFCASTSGRMLEGK